MDDSYRFGELFNTMCEDPLYQQVPLSWEVYSGIPLERIFIYPFHRSGFRAAHIQDLGQLLRSSYQDLDDEMGTFEAEMVMNELSEYLRDGTYIPEPKPQDSPKETLSMLLPPSRLVKEHREEILRGDFRFLRHSSLVKDEWEAIIPYVDAYRILGPFLAAQCRTNPDSLKGIASSFQDADYVLDVLSPRRESLFLMAENLSKAQKEQKLLPYLRCFAVSPREEELLGYAPEEEEDLTLPDLAGRIHVSNFDHFQMAGEFYQWCDYKLIDVGRRISREISENKKRHSDFWDSSSEEPQEWKRFLWRQGDIWTLKLPLFLARLRLDLGGGPIVPVSALKKYFRKHIGDAVKVLKILGREMFYTYEETWDAFAFTGRRNP